MTFVRELVELETSGQPMESSRNSQTFLVLSKYTRQKTDYWLLWRRSIWCTLEINDECFRACQLTVNTS